MPRDLRVSQAFDVLETVANPEARLMTRQSGIGNPWGELLFGVDSTGRRHLLIPIEAGGEILEDRASAGVQIHDTGVIAEVGRFADVICLRPHLGAIFEILVEDLLDALEDSADPVADAHGVLERWRELFERPRTSLLGTTELAGVVGELIVLRELAGPETQCQASWWTGPLGHVHDIVGPGHSLEVKTTLKRDDSHVVIHGLGQLASLPGRDLHLVFVRLLQDPAGLFTLPGLIDELSQTGLNRSELVSRAQSAGVDRRDYPTYDEIAFSIVAIEAFPTDVVGFPRLTEQSIGGPPPPGVSTVQYTADLNVVQVHAISDDRLRELFRSIALGESG